MDLSQQRLNILAVYHPINYIFSFPIMGLYLPYNPSELAKSHEIPQKLTGYLHPDAGRRLISVKSSVARLKEWREGPKKADYHEDQPGKNMKKWRLNMDKHGYHG